MYSWCYPCDVRIELQRNFLDVVNIDLENLTAEARRCGYRPFYDGGSALLATLKRFLEQKFDARVLFPENDLYSHLIVFDFSLLEVRLHIRFDFGIFVISCFAKNGSARYFAQEIEKGRGLIKSVIYFLEARELSEVDFFAIQCGENSGAIDVGLNGGTLFSFYFEDL